MLRSLLAIVVLAAAAPAHVQADAGVPAKRGLHGAWIFGAGTPEPKPGVVKRSRGCWEGGVETTLEQKGARVTGTIRWYPAAQGAEPPFSIQEGEVLEGSRTGNQVNLTGTYDRRAVSQMLEDKSGLPAPVHAIHKYLLVYNPETGHLVGTKDGKPFWAAPVEWILKPCGPPPP